MTAVGAGLLSTMQAVAAEVTVLPLAAALPAVSPLQYWQFKLDGHATLHPVAPPDAETDNW